MFGYHSDPKWAVQVQEAQSKLQEAEREINFWIYKYNVLRAECSGLKKRLEAYEPKEPKESACRCCKCHCRNCKEA